VGFWAKLFGGGSKGSKLKVANINKRFELQGRTGQGSMSKVFKAYDREIGRPVCLKLLDKEKTKRFEERFKGIGLKKPPEGEVCVSLSHVNCVKTYEHGLSTEGEPYLVMEWIDGLGMNYLIETNSPQMVGKKINYLAQLCDAITYLHGQKYLHRDLCPRNIMVDKDGTLKLIDFGLTIPYTPQFCQPGNRTGTVDYLAPEVIKRMTTDHRVDLFALGVTAYEMFTGALPWERSPSSEETLRRHLNVPPREPRDIVKKMEEDLARFLLRSVDRDRNQRYNSANQMKETLLKLENQDY
jgi:eukaryotic-like serine/threonine-protein kinase